VVLYVSDGCTPFLSPGVGRCMPSLSPHVDGGPHLRASTAVMGEHERTNQISQRR
jgi:hypothetical protein